MDVACYDTLGVDLTQLDTTWRQYRIPFGGLTQRNFGLPRTKLDSSSIYTIEFQLQPGHAVRLLARRHLVLLGLRAERLPPARIARDRGYRKRESTPRCGGSD